MELIITCNNRKIGNHCFKQSTWETLVDKIRKMPPCENLINFPAILTICRRCLVRPAVFAFLVEAPRGLAKFVMSFSIGTDEKSLLYDPRMPVCIPFT